MDKPIFIVGYIHSGTTLVQRIIGRHPEVFVGDGESRFFAQLPVIRRRFTDLTDAYALRRYVTYLIKTIVTGYDLVTFDAFGVDTSAKVSNYGISDDILLNLAEKAEKKDLRNHTDLFLFVMNSLTLSCGKKRWLEKTPQHVFHIEQILRDVPDALFVELVRDPRAVLASKKSRTTSEWLQQFAPEKRTIVALSSSFAPIIDSMAWRCAVNSGNRAERWRSEQVIRVRYEDLVSNPERKVRKICSFLGLTYCAEMLEVGWVNSTTAMSGNQSGISSASVDKWKEVLSEEEIMWIQIITSRAMKHLGYMKHPLSSKVYVKAPGCAVKSGLELVSRLRRRRKLEGDSHLINLLRRYLERVVRLFG